MKVLFVVPCGSHIACGAVRVLQFLPYLEGENVDYRVINYYHPIFIYLWKLEIKCRNSNHAIIRSFSFILKKLKDAVNRLYPIAINCIIAKSAINYDIIFLQRVILFENIIKSIKRKGVKIVFDFDDAIFLESPKDTDMIVRNASMVIAGSHFNYEYAIKSNPNTKLIPSSVPIEHFQINKVIKHNDGDRSEICIGWIGGAATMKYLDLLFQPLRELAAEGYNISLLIAGSWNYRDNLKGVSGLKIKEIPFYPSEDLPELVEKIDIGVMPLVDTSWEKGKCAMKALIYMAGGKPVVSSPVGEILTIIRDGENGLFAKSPDEWKQKLKFLIENPAKRHEFGEKGRATVEERFSTARCFSKLHNEVLLPLTAKSC